MRTTDINATGVRALGTKAVLDTLRKFSLANQGTGCLEWTGNLNHGGYGRFYLGGREFRAHRVSYVAHRTDIPTGHVLDHLCRNRKCINPDHLEPVTISVNVKRGFPGLNNASKTHCPSGHAYTAENTYRTKTGRACRHCNGHRVKR